MAIHLTHDRAAPDFGSVSDRAGSLLSQFAAWRARRREIGRIEAELNTYSDRHLAELGLCRGDIPDVARGHVRRA